MTIDNFVLHFVQKYFKDMNACKIQSIQMLWSGYGEIARYSIPNIGQTKIVKVVKPTQQGAHPRGWDGAVSHQRKVDSYLNELTFYKNYAEKTDSRCRVPSFIIGTSAPQNSEALLDISLNKNVNKISNDFLDGASHDISQYNGLSLLIMEDLDAAGFELRCTEAPLSIVKLGVRWLAHFHARFLTQTTDDLWQVGTYWHLATRQDEFVKMEKSELKSKAKKIDEQLNNARFQTLLHGDAKIANFCFSADTEDLAAVDFQYVGRGAGIKDMMYFLGSCLDSDELKQHADSLLDEYFSLLRKAIVENHVQVNFDELEAEWRYLYAFSWADFHRFLKGWATEHYKINDYMSIQTNFALAKCYDTSSSGSSGLRYVKPKLT